MFINKKPCNKNNCTCIRTAPVDVYLAEEIAKDEFFKYSYSTC